MQFTKSLRRCLRYDLLHGFRRQALFWLGGAAILLIVCLQLTVQHRSLRQASYLHLESTLTYGDYLLYLLHGMPRFVPGDQNFVPNVEWLLLHLYLACAVGSYPQRDLLETGAQIWLRSGSRRGWWISKCLWSAAATVFFYLLILLVPWLFSFAGMSPDWMPQNEIQQYFSSVSVAGVPPGRMLLHTVLLPLLTSVSLSLLQITLSLLTRPLFGLLAVAAMLVSAIFQADWWLPANYLMPTRCLTGSFHTGGCLLFFVLALCFAFGAGGWKIARLDLYSHHD